MQPNNQYPENQVLETQPIQATVVPVQPDESRAQLNSLVQEQASQIEPQQTAPTITTELVAESSQSQSSVENDTVSNSSLSSELPEVMPVSWQSHEYTQYDKSPVWYVILLIVTSVLIGLSILFNAWSFAVLIPIMVVALMMYAHRPPQTVNYTVSEQGLYINDTLHPMGEFRAFAVGKEMDHNSLVLIPIKRFRPSIKISFPDEVGESIVDVIGAFIPSQDFQIDLFDKIIQKLRI